MERSRIPLLRLATSRAISSAGRAPPRQGGGHWFEPSIAHLPRNPRSHAGFVVPEVAEQPAPTTALGGASPQSSPQSPPASIGGPPAAGRTGWLFGARPRLLAAGLSARRARVRRR